MNDPSASTRSGASSAGPTISFTFNLGKIPGQGEDSDPILRDGPDLGLVAVFDGMGGAGGTVYDTPDGPRTGAYLASRVARDVVEQRMLDLLEPDWNLNGTAAAGDLQRSVQDALQQRLRELNAPPSGLRSRLLRALPTTMALVALQRTRPGGLTWAGHVLWAGDSRAYVFEPDGARQLSTDDLRDPGDAMANLSKDSVVSNAMSADIEFHVNYRKVELRAPFLVVCATDGCFGYVSTPMHFEDMVLRHLLVARNPEEWSASLQSEISAVTGDDAAMAVLGVGADFQEFQILFAARADALAADVIEPLDELSQAVIRAEQELRALQTSRLDDIARIWHAYKPSYERYLRTEHFDGTSSSEDGATIPGNVPADEPTAPVVSQQDQRSTPDAAESVEDGDEPGPSAKEPEVANARAEEVSK